MTEEKLKNDTYDNESKIETLLKSARQFYTEGKTDKSSEIYKKIIKEYPGNAEAYWGIYLSEYSEYFKIDSAQYAFKRYVNECRDPYGMKAIALSDPNTAEEYRIKMKDVELIFDNLNQIDRKNRFEKTEAYYAQKAQRTREWKTYELIQYGGLALIFFLIIQILIAVIILIPLALTPVVGSGAILIPFIIIFSIIIMIALSIFLARYMFKMETEYYDKKSKKDE